MVRRMRKRSVSLSFFLVVLATSVTLVGCSFVATQQELAAQQQAADNRKWYFDSLILEIAPVMSCSPDQVALNRFAEMLEEHGICRRDRTVVLTRGEFQSFIPPVWDGGLIQLYEGARRELPDLDLEDRIGYVFVAYIRNPIMLGGELKILGGLQYSESAFAIFKDGANGKEAAVLLHEICHMIGLKKGRKADPKHHCPNRLCAMYPSIGSAYANLCGQCRQELKGLIARRHKRSDE